MPRLKVIANQPVVIASLWHVFGNVAVQAMVVVMKQKDPWAAKTRWWDWITIQLLVVSGFIYNLGGGNSKIFYFHPANWGDDSQFDEHIFKCIGSTTN